MKVIIKATIVAIGLLFTMAFTANAQSETPTENGEVKYYGEKVGFLKPCKGHLVAVCKSVTGFTSSSEGQNADEVFVIVDDGETKVKVNIEDFNFSDGSINENAELHPVEDEL
ncbi:MAG: hypothetical protein LBM67_01215 [Lentimicrobiaceae bacterium]|jgi:hypothetical protein|nr:hypothetical protein [Lentimicrobiaceae bacterium]